MGCGRPRHNQANYCVYHLLACLVVAAELNVLRVAGGRVMMQYYEVVGELVHKWAGIFALIICILAALGSCIPQARPGPVIVESLPHMYAAPPCCRLGVASGLRCLRLRRIAKLILPKL